MVIKKVVVLGSVNADHVLHVDAFPRPGETVSGHGYQVIPGGKGANQAVAAARMGASVAFVATVGTDDFGRRMIDELQSNGIDTRAVMSVPDSPSGIALILIAANGENAIAIAAEANGCLSPERLQPHLYLLHGADCVLMQLESPLESIQMAAREARRAGATVVLNPAPARPLPDALLSDLSIITPNETEAEMITGVKVGSASEAQRAAMQLHDKGVSMVIITLGANGAFYSGPDGFRHVAGFGVQAVDTTAAGDCFNGALVAALGDDLEMDAAIRFAHAAAAISVTRVGAQPSIPHRKRVDDFLKVKG